MRTEEKPFAKLIINSHYCCESQVSDRGQLRNNFFPPEPDRMFISFYYSFLTHH